MSDLTAQPPGGASSGGAGTPPMSIGGYQVVWQDTVTSTNDVAASVARTQSGADKYIVAAARQTAGRGRRGRHWVSEPGNLFLSILLRPPVPVAEAARLSFVAALAVAEALEAVVRQQQCGAPPSIACKWPNDVLANGDKLSGLLLESEAAADGRVDWLIIGIGVNIAHFPTEVERPATALHPLGIVDATPQIVLRAIIAAFAHRYDQWQAGGWPALRNGWKGRAAGLGQPVTVRLHDRSLSGIFRDLDADGVMLLEPPGGGPLQRITAGDVFLNAGEGG